MSDQSPGEGQPQFPPPQQYPGPADAPVPPPAQPPAYPTSYPAQPEAPQGSPQNPYGAPQYPAPPYGAPQYGNAGYGAPQYAGARDPQKRPGTVTAAAVITWISCVLSLGLAAVFFILAGAADQGFLDDLDSEGVDVSDITLDDLKAGLVVFGVILLVWSLSAIVAAVFAYRRSNAGRIVLVVSASVAILPLLLGTFTVILPGLLLLAAIATVVLLFTGGANEWYRSKNQPAPQPGQPTFY